MRIWSSSANLNTLWNCTDWHRLIQLKRENNYTAVQPVKMHQNVQNWMSTFKNFMGPQPPTHIILGRGLCPPHAPAYNPPAPTLKPLASPPPSGSGFPGPRRDLAVFARHTLITLSVKLQTSHTILTWNFKVVITFHRCRTTENIHSPNAKENWYDIIWCKHYIHQTTRPQAHVVYWLTARAVAGTRVPDYRFQNYF